jgi:hypothetical protein
MVVAWSWLLAEFQCSVLKVCFLPGSLRLCVLAIFVITENTSRSKFLNFESSKVSVRCEPSCSLCYSLSCLSFILGAAWSGCIGDWWRWNAGSLARENSLSMSLRFVAKKNKNPTMNHCGYYHIYHRIVCKNEDTNFSNPLTVVNSPPNLFVISRLLHSACFLVLRLNSISSPQHCEFNGFPTTSGCSGYSYVLLSSG